MPKTITTTVYTYDELPTEKAKEKARDWFSEVVEYDDAQNEFDDVREDARRIGVRISRLCGPRANEGDFITSAPEVAENIKSEHGAICDTYKLAEKYLADLAELGDRPEEEEDEKGFSADSDWEIIREELDNTFLASLLEEYRVMLAKNIEYRQSEESIVEAIETNEYTFTEDGKRFG